jgi:hypothetical protein
MDNHYKELIRFRLMEEISNINTQVEALGRPRITAERSLIARYGKLLFVSQQLLEQLTELQIDEASGLERRIPAPVQRDLIPGRTGDSFSRRLGVV